MKVAAVTLLCMVALVNCAPTGDNSEESWEIIPYNYGYEIQDPESGNFQNKAEVKLPNGDVFGSYSVLMPDGYVYTTTYNITAANGYTTHLAKVKAPSYSEEVVQVIDLRDSEPSTEPAN